MVFTAQHRILNGMLAGVIAVLASGCGWQQHTAPAG